MVGGASIFNGGVIGTASAVGGKKRKERAGQSLSLSLYECRLLNCLLRGRGVCWGYRGWWVIYRIGWLGRRLLSEWSDNSGGTLPAATITHTTAAALGEGGGGAVCLAGQCLAAASRAVSRRCLSPLAALALALLDVLDGHGSHLGHRTVRRLMKAQSTDRQGGSGSERDSASAQHRRQGIPVRKKPTRVKAPPRLMTHAVVRGADYPLAMQYSRLNRLGNGPTLAV